MYARTLLAAAVAAGAVYAQNATMNLTAAITSNTDLSALGTLLQSYPNVAASLANATNVTLLAPNNDAINALLNSSSMSLTNVSESQIAALLNYHVLNSTIYADNITSTPQFVPTFLNDTAYTNVTGGQVVECVREGDNVVIYSGLRNNATVVTPNVNYTGGVIHIIDSVLTIPLNVSFSAVVGGFSDLVGAAMLAGGNLTAVVDTTPDLTVFVPTNEAFENIGSAVGNLTAEQVTAILEYHVINGTVAYSSTLVNGSAPTLQGGNVTITIEDGAVFINQARVIVADVLVANGVAHVIDSVLNSNDTSAMPSPSATTPVVAYSGASSTSVALTSGVPSNTMTANPALTSADSSVVESASQTATSLGANPNNQGSSSSSSGMAAAMPIATGAIGAAALFGAGAFVANL